MGEQRESGTLVQSKIGTGMANGTANKLWSNVCASMPLGKSLSITNNQYGIRLLYQALARPRSFSEERHQH